MLVMENYTTKADFESQEMTEATNMYKSFNC